MSNLRGPGSGGMQRHLTSQKPSVRNIGKTLRRFWKYTKGYRPQLFLVFGLVLLVSLREMLNPWLTGIAIDRYIATRNLSGLIKPVLAMVFLLAGAGLAGWLQQVLMVRITQKILYSLREELFRHLLKLDIRYHDRHPHGELMSRFTNDIDTIGSVIPQVLGQFFSSILSLVGVTVMMLLLNPPLTGIALASVPLIFLLTGIIGKRTRKRFSEQQALLGKMNGQIEETVTGLGVVKLFLREASAAEALEETNRKFRKTASEAQILSGWVGPFMNMTNNLRYLLTAVGGGLLAIHGLTSVGTIAAFLNYIRLFGRPLNEMAQMYNSILSAMAGAERVFDLLDEKPEIVSPEIPEGLPVTAGHIELQRVTFGYEPDNPVLNAISLDIAPGTTAALVGPTGAGKTTIANLLTRFYDIGSGTIRIDGRDIRDYRLEDLRQSIGLVLQDTVLFEGTVMENIRYGNLSASDGEVLAAARSARADHFIRHLPEGYNTLIAGGGLSLSQGQRQLIAIARALLADPVILILDEATSSVDTRTEQLLQEGLNHLMKGRTSLVIAHRLSTIRNADTIIVLQQGTIAEQGTHRELLEKQGLYASLHAAHFETELR